MGWFSILPENWSAVETWAARIFIVLGIICIGPWTALIIYDIILYVWRSITHEIPFVGGRARGRARPRAPSLKESRRRFSLGRPSSGAGMTSSREYAKNYQADSDVVRRVSPSG